MLNIDKFMHFVLVSLLPAILLCVMLGFACIANSFDNETTGYAWMAFNIFGFMTLIYGWASFATGIVLYKVFNAPYWLAIGTNLVISLYGCYWLLCIFFPDKFGGAGVYPG
tara:strand:- start:843 stop:1175 length:333 start_codon:yes stop_codon:yes gene_type:complete